MLESKQEVTNVTFLVKRAENLPGLSRPLANSCTNSIIFPRKHVLIFHANCLLLSGKIKKNISKCRLLNFFRAS